MEILIPIAIIAMLCVGAAFTGKRLAYLHAGKVDSFLPKRKTKEQTKSDFRASRREIIPHDWSDYAHPLQKHRDLFNNKLERYARFLELRLRFDIYDGLTDEERAGMKKSAAPTTVTPNERGGKDVILGDCRFLCGTAPCSCEHEYSIFQTLRPEFINEPNHYPVYQNMLDDILFETTQ